MFRAAENTSRHSCFSPSYKVEHIYLFVLPDDHALKGKERGLLAAGMVTAQHYDAHIEYWLL